VRHEASLFSRGFFVGFLCEDRLHHAGHRRILTVAAAGALVLGAAPPASAARRWSARPAVQGDAARVVTDETGRRVRMPSEVKRIVTLAPNLTETVYALGLGERLAGDTEWCDTPADAKRKPHVGNPQDPSLEAIVALHPDLVLATTSINRAETADALQQLGIPVYTSDPHTVRGMLASIARMAELMGAKEQGIELTERLEQRLDALGARLAERPLVHVLFVVWDQPLISVGQNTFIADALRFAGAESVVLSDQNWPQLSLEEVVRLQPDYLVFPVEHAGESGMKLAGLRARPVWKDLAAVQMGHVVDVSEEAVRPSPGLVDAIEDLAHELHPEVFAEKSEMRDSKIEMRFAPGRPGEAGRECSPCVR
jgi:cobalamin transport system substrate-binding protein